MGSYGDCRYRGYILKESFEVGKFGVESRRRGDWILSVYLFFEKFG